MNECLRNIWSPEYFAGISASLSVIAGANCYGWFAPTINYLLDPENPERMTESQVSWLLSIITFGELIGTIPAGLISDKYGRKIIFLLTGPIFFFCWIVVLFTKSYAIFIVIRIIQGIGGAIVFTVGPVYFGEISSSANRGSITGLFSVGWFVGFLVEYCLGAVLSLTPFTIVTAAIPFIFTILFYFQPESPCYQIMEGKEMKAKTTLQYLRGSRFRGNIEHELEDIKESVKRNLDNKCSWKDIIKTSADRRALFIVLLLDFTRVQSGHIPLMTYSSNLFLESGFSLLSPNVLTILLGIAMLLSGLFSSYVVDSLGRRPVIIISCLGSFLSLVLIAIYFFFKEHAKTDVSYYGWVVPLGVIMTCTWLAVGLVPVPITYTSELFTNKTRGKSASIITMSLTIGAFINVKLYQIIGDYFGLCTVFVYFSLISLFGGITLYYIAPETKGKTFTQIRTELMNVRSKNKTGKYPMEICLQKMEET